MTNSIQLLPCPFCLFETIHINFVENPHGGDYFECYCGDCEASTGRNDSRENAIKAWNSRAGNK